MACAAYPGALRVERATTCPFLLRVVVRLGSLFLAPPQRQAYKPMECEALHLYLWPDTTVGELLHTFLEAARGAAALADGSRAAEGVVGASLASCPTPPTSDNAVALVRLLQCRANAEAGAFDDDDDGGHEWSVRKLGEFPISSSAARDSDSEHLVARKVLDFNVIPGDVLEVVMRA